MSLPVFVALIGITVTGAVIFVSSLHFLVQDGYSDSRLFFGALLCVIGATLFYSAGLVVAGIIPPPCLTG